MIGSVAAIMEKSAILMGIALRFTQVNLANAMMTSLKFRCAGCLMNVMLGAAKEERIRSSISNRRMASLPF